MRNGELRNVRKIGLFLALGLAVVAWLWLSQRNQRQLLERLVALASQRGVQVEFGRSTLGYSSATAQDVKLSFRDAPGITIAVNRLVARAQLFGATRVEVDELSVSLAGEPSTWFASLDALPSWEGLEPTTRQVTLEYAHKIFGKVLLDDVQFERQDATYSIRAASVRLGAVSWQNVRGSFARRNELIELGVGEGPIQDAPIQIGYYPSTRGASQWTLTVKYQPAQSLGRRVGWDLGPKFASATLVGSVSFIVPDDPALAVRGSLQVVMDSFPRPGWPEADRLLGNTLAFTSRIEPSSDMSRWDLPQVDMAVGLFSLTGVARLDFGSESRIQIDAEGGLTCAQLGGNLPPSSYLDSVKGHLASANTAPRSGSHEPRSTKETAQLRLQLSAIATEQGPHQAAWHLSRACGIAELTDGLPQTLDLPAYVKKVRGKLPP